MRRPPLLVALRELVLLMIRHIHLLIVRIPVSGSRVPPSVAGGRDRMSRTVVPRSLPHLPRAAVVVAVAEEEVRERLWLGRTRVREWLRLHRRNRCPWLEAARAEAARHLSAPSRPGPCSSSAGSRRDPRRTGWFGRSGSGGVGKWTAAAHRDLHDRQRRQLIGCFIDSVDRHCGGEVDS